MKTIFSRLQFRWDWVSGDRSVPFRVLPSIEITYMEGFRRFPGFWSILFAWTRAELTVYINDTKSPLSDVPDKILNRNVFTSQNK